MTPDSPCTTPSPSAPRSPAAANPGTALPPFRAIADLVREHAAARPTQPALVQGRQRSSLDWQGLDRLLDRVATALQQGGARPGDSIAICAANSINYAAVFLGALRAGVAVAPLPSVSSQSPVLVKPAWRAWSAQISTW